tara:strand:- start:124 stop:489 length:366 start_codon:yes stop_codon:yes gene_type:complete
MRQDFFSLIQEKLTALPEGVHMLAFASLLMLYAFLCFGFWMERKKHKTHVKIYFSIRTSLIMLYMFIKASDTGFGMFDLFLPVYIIGWIDGLIVIKGFTFYRCENLKDAFKRMTNFNTYRK